MSKENRDEVFMKAALREARRGLGQTSPNPAVGAVLVLNNKVMARGHHRQAGAPHAEIECLRQFGKRVPKSATLYVTLEPCSTTGRTGPCTEALIESGMTRIVVGALDPNPRHSGRGIRLLRKAGLQVHNGVLATECSELNEAFNKWIQTRRPFVIAKCGMSLDGRLTAPPSEGRWLTSAAARKHAHGLRAQVDAILVGAETVRADNPRLTVRGVRGSRQPWRIVVSRSGSLPAKARIFTDRYADRTMVFREIELGALLGELGEKEITSVLVEGGGDILGQALDHHLIDKVQAYVAPIFTGGPAVSFAGVGANSTGEASRLARVSYEQIGNDICVTGYPASDRIAGE
jgi:diaminohydroxyphosphoribosylaminopyrimidine deaminase/5-amino-6-(5-phosphoribosylamino)uracil reductase